MSFFESLPEPFPKETAREQEAALAKKIIEGDEMAANELVMHNMKEAILYTRCVSRNLDSGALMSLCYEALLRNAKRFDPTRQRFFAFAKPGLRGALYRNYNKNKSPLPEFAEHAPENRGEKTKVHIEPDAGRPSAMEDYDPVAKVHIAEPDMEGIFTRDRWTLVKPVMDSKCSEQEKMVLNLTYVSGFNFQESGDLLGITRSAVQRCHWRAVKKLRTEMGRRKQLL